MKGEFLIKENEHLSRLDVVFFNHFQNLTRSHIKTLIDSGEILLNDKIVKAGEKVKTGWKVSYDFKEPQPLDVQAEEIDCEIVYEDSDLLVINKPQGLVVHPCASTKTGTLVNGLLNRVKDLSGINGVLRPGIIHRLDKDTSGLMLVAKNDFAHKNLAEQIKNKVCKRTYIALCDGLFKNDEGKIETFIERSKNDRKKMAVSDKGKKAITNYKVLKRFSNKTLVEFSLETGRTHQIRVHCKMMNHSIIGDPVYGKAVASLGGQLLHSYKIAFYQPHTNKLLSFEIGLPKYFEDYLKKLK